jgi:hypothetical protein
MMKKATSEIASYVGSAFSRRNAMYLSMGASPSARSLRELNVCQAKEICSGLVHPSRP